MKIKTNNVFPPIPIRQFDWCAWDDDKGEDGSKYGWGATEQAAIDDFLDNVNDHCLTSAEQAAQASRCNCRGADDLCVCQNAPDAETRAARRLAFASQESR